VRMNDWRICRHGIDRLVADCPECDEANAGVAYSPSDYDRLIADWQSAKYHIEPEQETYDPGYRLP